MALAAVRSRPRIGLFPSVGASLDINYQTGLAVVGGNVRAANSVIPHVRSTVGYHIGFDGRLVSTAANLPRVVRRSDGRVKGMLVERSLALQVLYSDDFSLWTPVGTAGVSSTAVVGPDGTSSTKRRLTNILGYANRMQQAFTHPGAGNCTFSIWVKTNGNGTTFTLRIGQQDLSPAAYDEVNSGTLTATDRWQRFTLTRTMTAGYDLAYVMIYGVDATSLDVSFGNSTPSQTATSEMLTTSGAFTRGADQPSLILSGQSWWNSSQGTVLVDVDIDGGADESQTLVSFTTDANNTIWIYRDGVGKNMVGRIINGGVNQTVLTMQLGTTNNIWHRVAFCWSGNYAAMAMHSGLFLNSDIPGSIRPMVDNSGGSITVPSAAALQPGHLGGGAQLDGTISRLVYWPYVLSDAEMSDLVA